MLIANAQQDMQITIRNHDRNLHFAAEQISDRRVERRLLEQARMRIAGKMHMKTRVSTCCWPVQV
jgi:hypothetical protein